jgi:hypothetical protein
MDDNKKTERKKIDFKFWGIFLFLGVFVLWFASWGAIDFLVAEETNRGTFGDKFGAVNALFSGLAFAGLIVTILLQREELHETQEAVKNQTKEFEKQNETLALQRFENSFFNMLSQHNEMVSLMSEYAPGGNRIGKAVIINYVCELKRLCNEKYAEISNKFPNNEPYINIKPSVDEGFLNFLNQSNEFIKPYLKSIFKIFDYINRQPYDADTKNHYAELLLSQLLMKEIELIALYGANGERDEVDTKKKLIEDLQLLRNFENKNEGFERSLYLFLILKPLKNKNFLNSVTFSVTSVFSVV